MVDVQYAFPDADSCLAVIKDWERFNLFFLETPLPSDDLAGYARLANEQSIPIAAGEWLTTRFEFLDLMERGKVSVVQPDIGRVGGLLRRRRVCDLAAERGVKVVPHAWKSASLSLLPLTWQPLHPIWNILSSCPKSCVIPRSAKNW